MRNIYVMIFITILFFLLSFDIIIYTSTFFDVLLVIIYLILVSQSALNLESENKKLDIERTICEKKTAYFAPLIFMPFLGTSYEIGIWLFIINIVIIFALYGYVFVSIKRNKITITDEKVSVNYLNKNMGSMEFRKITKVEFNWFYNYLGIIDSENNKVILDITLKDFIIVINLIKEKVEEEIYQEAFLKLEKFYTIFLIKSNIKRLK